MLAVAYAVRLAKEIGAQVFLGICQSNQVSHTGADAVTRILGQPTFVGQIAGGRRVLIVDDVATFGSTLANLRGWIEHQGAHVIRATTLGATFGGTKLAQPREALDKLLNRFPEVETLSRNLGFTPDCFTGRETYFLAQVPHRKQMQALVAASEKVRALLNPIAIGLVDQGADTRTPKKERRRPDEPSRWRERPWSVTRSSLSYLYWKSLSHFFVKAAFPNLKEFTSVNGRTAQRSTRFATMDRSMSCVMRRRAAAKASAWLCRPCSHGHLSVAICGVSRPRTPPSWKSAKEREIVEPKTNAMQAHPKSSNALLGNQSR